MTIKSVSKNFHELGFDDKDLANGVRFLEAHRFIEKGELPEDAQRVRDWRIVLDWNKIDQVCWEHGTYMFPAANSDSPVLVCQDCRRKE